MTFPKDSCFCITFQTFLIWFAAICTVISIVTTISFIVGGGFVFTATSAILDILSVIFDIACSFLLLYALYKQDVKLLKYCIYIWIISAILIVIKIAFPIMQAIQVARSAGYGSTVSGFTGPILFTIIYTVTYHLIVAWLIHKSIIEINAGVARPKIADIVEAEVKKMNA